MTAKRDLSSLSSYVSTIQQTITTKLSSVIICLDSDFYSGLRKDIEWNFPFWLMHFTKWNQLKKD